MNLAQPPDGRPEFLRELAAIREDPAILRLALARAGTPDLAEDALQETCYAIARLTDWRKIRELRRYFCIVLRHEAYRLRGQLQPIPVENPQDLMEVSPHGALACGPPAPQPEQAAEAALLAQAFLERFAMQYERLCAAVPARSPDGARYREVIARLAGEVLSASLADDAPADSNEALRAAYPEWFDEKDSAENNLHQRYTRARKDIRNLLKIIIGRTELD